MFYKWIQCTLFIYDYINGLHSSLCKCSILLMSLVNTILPNSYKLWHKGYEKLVTGNHEIQSLLYVHNYICINICSITTTDWGIFCRYYLSAICNSLTYSTTLLCVNHIHMVNLLSSGLICFLSAKYSRFLINNIVKHYFTCFS